MTIIVAYVLSCNEYERGFGQRPDGYLCFETEKLAEVFLKAQDALITDNAPDCYVLYYKVGYRECSLSNLEKIRTHGKMWVSILTELKT